MSNKERESESESARILVAHSTDLFSQSKMLPLHFRD